MKTVAIDDVSIGAAKAWFFFFTFIVVSHRHFTVRIPCAQVIFVGQQRWDEKIATVPGQRHLHSLLLGMKKRRAENLELLQQIEYVRAHAKWREFLRAEEQFEVVDLHKAAFGERIDLAYGDHVR